MNTANISLLKNTVLLPLDGTMDSFTGGVYTAEGQFVEDSLLHRGKPALFQKYVEELSGTYIYGGCLFGHFGHFIWESLSRLYAIRQCKDYPILFISPNDKIYDVHSLLFKTIGIRNEIRLVKIPTSVNNLIYSPPGSSISPLFIIDEQINKMQYFTFSKNGNKSKTTKEKIWLSRSKLKNGKVTNEHEIEEKLRKIGYTIIHPEALHFREQVRLISTSDVVAGFDGSAFFSLLFAKEIRSKFIVFNRRRDIPKTIPYVFQKRNVEFNQYIFDLQPINEEWPVSLFYHSEPNKLIEVLGEC
ncbi:MAG: glycosyltransferase family 61 protein [Desulfovibrio sp.]|jgi:hypothetical protein|nr:glycosyltransferase family 61 protein [Desulfovibrio sp.]